MSLFTKRERSLIFSGLRKYTFLKSMLLSNFLIRWSWNILNTNNVSMMLNKCLIQRFWVDVTTKPPFFGFVLKPSLINCYKNCQVFAKVKRHTYPLHPSTCLSVNGYIKIRFNHGNLIQNRLVLISADIGTK